MGSFRVLAGLAERPPLAQQVPALVEADLERLEPVVLVRVQSAFADAVVELVLLGDELLDAIVDLFVVHAVSMPQPNSAAVRTVVMGYTLSAEGGLHDTEDWRHGTGLRGGLDRRADPLPRLGRRLVG